MLLFLVMKQETLDVKYIVPYYESETPEKVSQLHFGKLFRRCAAPKRTVVFDCVPMPLT